VKYIREHRCMVVVLLAVLASAACTLAEGSRVVGPNPWASPFLVTPDWGVIGRWRVRAGDDPSYAEPRYDDDDWAPFGSETVAHMSNEGGYFWYRTHLSLPPGWDGKRVFLRTGWIADRADIYINGRPVVKNVSAQYCARNLTNHTVCFPYRGRMPKTLIDISHTYDVTDLLDFGGPNVLAVRLYTFTTRGGIGMMGIGVQASSGLGLGVAKGSRVLFFGDSITDQAGEIDSYPRRIWDVLNSFYPSSNITIINFGRNAETTSRALRRLGEIAAQRPDVVVINLGINDLWWAGIGPSKYRENLKEIVGNISSETGGQMLLSTLTPLMLDENGEVSKIYSADSPYTDLEKEYNAAVRSVAEEWGLTILPFHTTFEAVLNRTEYSGQRAAGYLLQRDGVHPNAWGASLLAWVVLDRVFSMPEECMDFLQEVWGYGAEAIADSRPPESRIDPKPETDGWLTEEFPLRILAEDPMPGSGVAAVFYSIDGKRYHKYSGPIEPSEGVHNYSYFSVDNAGNAEVPHRLLLRVDNSAPVISFEACPEEVAPWQSPQVVVRAEDVSGVVNVTCRFRVDAGSVDEVLMRREGAFYACRLPGLPPLSEVNYWILARDESGHASQSPNRSYVVGEALPLFLGLLVLRFMGALLGPDALA